MGHTPLHNAAYQGHVEVCKLLIEHKANISIANIEMGSYPIHVGVEQGHVEVCKLLLAQNADVNSKRKDGKAPLHVAASNLVHTYDSI